jgi:hypothetical protein
MDSHIPLFIPDNLVYFWITLMIFMLHQHITMDTSGGHLARTNISYTPYHRNNAW